MKPNPAALSLSASTLALIACSLFAGRAPTPTPVGRGPAEATPTAPGTLEPETDDDPTPTPVAFAVVDALSEEGPLAEVLADHASRAVQMGLRPFVEFTATWCPSCNALADSLEDPRMIEAFRGVYLVRVDIDEWERSLPGSAFRVFGVPTFFEVDERGLPTGRMLTGAAWGRDIVENMAPVLKEFFAGD
jgi:thiol-disulfide isomerase/thioredoxin